MSQRVGRDNAAIWIDHDDCVGKRRQRGFQRLLRAQHLTEVGAAKLSEGCGGLTGVTPLGRYRDWIVQAAGKLGSPLAPSN